MQKRLIRWIKKRKRYTLCALRVLCGKIKLTTERLRKRLGACYGFVALSVVYSGHGQKRLSQQVQEITGDSVEIAFVDQGYTGDKAAAAAEEHGIRLEVVKLPTAKHGFVLLPRRWVVERSFGWMTRFRRLVRNYERLAETLVGLHFVAFAMVMAHRFITFMVQNA